MYRLIKFMYKIFSVILHEIKQIDVNFSVQQGSIYIYKQTKNYTLERIWVFATNSEFLILISLQPNVVNLRYFNQCFCKIKWSKFEISKVYIINSQRYRDLKILVCGKESIPFIGFLWSLFFFWQDSIIAPVDNLAL